MTRLHNIQYAGYGQGHTIHNIRYTYYCQCCVMHNALYACYDTATQYTIRMLWPGPCNTQYTIKHMLWPGLHYAIHMLLPSLRNTQYQRGHNPHNDVPSFWSPCGLMCLTEDSLATFGGIRHESSVKRESICAHWNGQRQSRRKRGVSSQRIFKCLRRRLSDLSNWRQNNVEARQRCEASLSLSLSDLNKNRSVDQITLPK